MAVLCSSAYNPLAQFEKHTTGDRGSQIDRLVSRHNDSVGQGFRSDRRKDSKQITNEFANYGRNYAPLPPQDSGLQHVSLAQEGPSTQHNGLNWGLEFNAARVNYRQTQQLSGHETRQAYSFDTSSSSNQAIRNTDTQSHFYRPNNGHTHQMRPGATGLELNPMLAMVFHHSRAAIPATRQAATLPIEDLDWETVFASLESAENASRSKVIALESATVQDIAMSGVLDNSTSSVVPGLRETSNEPIQKPAIEPVKVEPPLLETPRSAYRFQEENPFKDNLNPFEEGLDILRNDGNLSFAVLAFEAACQNEPDHFDAWLMLGSTNSENEREENAITALREALKLDPSSLIVLMRLAISYTNEGTISLAHENLEKWLRSKYPEISIAEFGPTNYSPTYSQSLERIKDAFIRAAQLSVATGKIDPDVQVGLGVLLFSAQHYELAADCFSSAIQTTVPGDTNTQSQLHLLWNRYGACLGNMNQHEAGIEAYEMALAIRPNFVRARYNLGLLYNNKKEPLLGAKNTLQALVEYRAAESKARTDMLRIVKVGSSHGMLEEIIPRDEPTSIYETLRKCCGSMCRWDLAEMVGPDMDMQAFGKELDKL